MFWPDRRTFTTEIAGNVIHRSVNFVYPPYEATFRIGAVQTYRNCLWDKKGKYVHRFMLLQWGRHSRALSTNTRSQTGPPESPLYIDK